MSLRNTSDRTSREVVQVYFGPAEPPQPIRLVGWASAEAAAGQPAEVTVSCDRRMWRRWDTSRGCWQNIPEAGELLIARGLGDIRIRLSVPSAPHGR